MKKPKWVRGVALQTVLALNAFQVGDELLVQRIEGKRWERARKTTTKLHDGQVVIRCCCQPICELPIPIENAELVGWRRVVDK